MDASQDWVIKYFERVIEEQGRRIEQAQNAARAAVDKAEQAQERRLDLLNEFRAQAADESRKYALKETTESRLTKIETSLARAYGGLLAVAFVGVANIVKLWLS